MTGARGEGRLQTPSGVEVVVLFTNRALAEAERATGKSVLQLADAGRGTGLGIGDLANLLAIGMEFARREAGTGGPRITLGNAYSILDEVGFVKVAQVVLEALATVLSYGAGESDEDPTLA